jgi:hypothetical protein
MVAKLRSARTEQGEEEFEEEPPESNRDAPKPPAPQRQAGPELMTQLRGMFEDARKHQDAKLSSTLAEWEKKLFPSEPPPGPQPKASPPSESSVQELLEMGRKLLGTDKTAKPGETTKAKKDARSFFAKLGGF